MLIIILLVVAFVVYYFGINRMLGLPPGPRPLPLIGNLLSFQWDMDKVFLDWKSRYGRIFTVWMPHPIIVIGDHKVLQEHLIKNSNVYLYKKNPEQLCDIWFGGEFGVGFHKDDVVKEQRKFALKTLQEVGIGSAALEDTIHSFALEISARWRKSDGKAVDVSENIAKAIGNIVWNVTFGVNLGFDNKIVLNFRQLQAEFLPLIAGPLMMALESFPFLRKLDFLFGFHFKKVQTLLHASNSMLQEAIDTAKQSFNPDNQPNSFIEAFLREMMKNEEAGRPMGNFHNRELLASCSALWGAGVDTTVGTLRLCILELVNNPKVQIKLQKEIDDVIGERRIRYDDQKLLPYTCAYLQEVYRLGNVLPVNFLRKTTQTTEIEGYSIPAGTTVLPQFSMVHADEKEFERPDYFCPERHIDSEGYFVKDPRITPFSIGARACIGETLARTEIFVLLATFVQNCHFAPVGKVPPSIEFTDGFARFAKAFTVRIEPRN